MYRSIFKKSIISALLALAMILGLSLGFGFNDFEKQSVYADANEVLNISYSNYPRVNVSNDEELRTALTSDSNKFIVVTADITVESELMEKVGDYQYYSEIEQIVVKGNKILHLNGHEIYYQDCSQLRWYRTTGGFGNELSELSYNTDASDKYFKTLINVSNGAQLTIADNDENEGVLQFDSRFGEVDDAAANVVRNVVEVKTGGKLNIHGGNIIAGRNKQVYSYIRDAAASMMRSRAVTCYIMGSAVIVNGGNVAITGGTLKGRGWNDSSKNRYGTIRCVSGSLYIENAKVFGYGRSAAICFSSWPISTNVNIKSGYFESYCETYASYYGHSTTLEMDKPCYQAFAVQNNGHYQELDSINDILADAENANVTTNVDHSTSTNDAGDWGKECVTITQGNKALNNALLNSKNTNSAVDIYQHQKLNVVLNYWDYAYWKYHSQFNCTDIMKSYNGVISDANLLKEYYANNGITAYFTISKKVGNEYKATSAFSVVNGMNEQFPLDICIKAGEEKWDVGEYKVACEITEKSAGKTISNYTNVLTVNVASSTGMLVINSVYFDGSSVNEGVSNLGNIAAGTHNFSFNAYSNRVLDNHLEVRKQFMKKGPNDNKYYEIQKDNNGRYVINAEDIGYYSIVMYAQLYNTSLNKIVAQNSREVHFATIDTTRTVTVTENPNGTILLADVYGKVRNTFKAGERVYIQITPKSGCVVKSVTVKQSNNSVVTVTNDSFVMPDSNVTVSAVFGIVHKLVYRETPTSPIDDEVVVSSGQDIILKGATYEKFGYKQTGWYIGNGWANLGDPVRIDANVTAIPMFSPYKYNNIWYNVGEGKDYLDGLGYDSGESLYYTIKGDSSIPSAYQTSAACVSYYEIREDYVSEIEGITYTSGTKFYPGQQIIPMGDGIKFYAVLEPLVQISPIEIMIKNGDKLGVGENNTMFDTSKLYHESVFDVAYADAPNVSIKNGNQLTINPRTETSFIITLCTQLYYLLHGRDDDWENSRFAEEDYMVIDLNYFTNNQLEDLAFTKAPTWEYLSLEENARVLKIKLTLYPSCGNDTNDHQFELTDHAHWCVDAGENGHYYNEYTCSVCGVKEYRDAGERPDNLTLEQEHHIKLVGEVLGDCTQGIKSIAQHYECEDCGQCFSKVFGGPYVEKTIDDFTYLHKWSDYIPSTKLVDGNQVNIHYCVCSECGLVDEESVGYHHNHEHGYGQCDECSYYIPCVHQWSYQEVLSTCSHQGSMTKTCDICGDMETIIYNFADHTLELIPVVYSTCSTHGVVAHFKCIDCGELFDTNIYDYINLKDPTGLRFIADLDDPSCEYALTDEMLDLLENEYSSDDDYKYYDAVNDLYFWDWAYIKAHCATYNSDEDFKKVIDAHEIVDDVNKYVLEHKVTLSQLQLAYDPTIHTNTEIRNAAIVTANTDGYSGDLYCVDCEEKIEEGHVIAKHTHKYTGNEWEFDATNHYHICNAFDGCTEHLAVAEHNFGDWNYLVFADRVGQKWRECSVCGYIEVEDYIPGPTNNNYTISENMEDVYTQEGKDVKYIFDLANANDSSVTFEIDNIEIVFDVDAVKNIALNSIVNLKMGIQTQNLDGFNIENAQMLLTLSLGGVTFSSGKAIVTISNVQIDKNGEIKVYYLNGNNREDMGATYSSGNVTFETTHFSDYVVAYTLPKAGGGFPILIVIIIAVVIGGGLCAFLLTRKKGNKLNTASDN